MMKNSIHGRTSLNSRSDYAGIVFINPPPLRTTIFSCP